MDSILVMDFGGQYSRLIARRIRAEHVYAEIRPYSALGPQEIKAAGYKGIIFTGGPNSVNDPSSPSCSREVLELGIPVLGICYGHQLMASLAGGKVGPSDSGSEYGSTRVRIKAARPEGTVGPVPSSGSMLLAGVPEESICWMSHTDHVIRLPEGFTAAAETAKCPCAAMECGERKLYGVQFHPEVTHTEWGARILRNFIFDICGASPEWTMEDFALTSVERWREELAGRKVLLALSGGVDSSVAAALLHRAIGDDLKCVFVDHGLLRKNEADEVEATFRARGLEIIRVDAQERFLGKLAGVTDPEEKRKIIGSEFIRAFEEEAGKLGKIDVLAQGTIYPDVIESGEGSSAVIKSHHNVGGLPERMGFSSIAEPLRLLFKDEVREVGRKLGLPDAFIERQPFPGPGLAVRITGEITPEKIAMLQDADAIFREEVTASTDSGEFPDLEAPSQYFAVLADVRTVGVMGDFRTYGYTIALRAVSTDDFMTAKSVRIPYGLLERVSTRITNEVSGITRVVYDITSKPPATVEWL